MNKSKLGHTLEREDNYEDFKLNKRSDDDIQCLNLEISKLEYILNKYNFILNEYQLKFGNELFNELEQQINTEMIEPTQMSEFRKILVENVSLIKEYEKTILEKDKTVDRLNEEVNRIQVDLEKIVEENKELREDLEVTKEENNKMYRNALMNPEGEKSMQNFGNKSMPTNFGKTTGYKQDLNSALDLVKEQNEHLLQTLEKTKYELENTKSALGDYRDKYEKLFNDNEKLERDYTNICEANNNMVKKTNYFEEKIKENNNKMLINEKKTTETTNSLNKIEIENKYLKQELNHYKEMYDELEKRKNSEIDILMRDLKDTKNYLADLKGEFADLKETSSDLSFENSRLKQELQIVKYDCDHMTKILEESNFAVKAAAEKEKNIDTTTKMYKRKIEELHLEKDKSLVRQSILEKQIMKIVDDYRKQLAEKQTQYENFIDSSKERFEKIISDKNEEMANLKSDLISIKIEKDKFQSEYGTIKKEYDKFYDIFREENEKYIKKYEESEKGSIRVQNMLQDKIINLNKNLEKLEHEKNIATQELDIYKSSDKDRDILIEKYTKSESLMSKETSKIRERSEILSKQNEELKKEIQRNKEIYDKKISQLKEQGELKLKVLENTMKYQQDQFKVTENKAFEMLKKQENVTDKFKEEYRSTVHYYENLIENLLQENRALKKQNIIENETFNDEELPEKI